MTGFLTPRKPKPQHTSQTSFSRSTRTGLCIPPIVPLEKIIAVQSLTPPFPDRKPALLVKKGLVCEVRLIQPDHRNDKAHKANITRTQSKHNTHTKQTQHAHKANTTRTQSKHTHKRTEETRDCRQVSNQHKAALDSPRVAPSLSSWSTWGGWRIIARLHLTLPVPRPHSAVWSTLGGWRIIDWEENRRGGMRGLASK